MKELDDMIEFFVNNSNDDRIKISKKIKYGSRYYYINFHIDDDPSDKTRRSYMNEYLEIVVDNRNKCIEINVDSNIPIIIEDDESLKKWSYVLEQYMNKNIKQKITDSFESSLSSCFKKDLYRQYQMKKILPDDPKNESI